MNWATIWPKVETFISHSTIPGLSSSSAAFSISEQCVCVWDRRDGLRSYDPAFMWEMWIQFQTPALAEMLQTRRSELVHKQPLVLSFSFSFLSPSLFLLLNFLKRTKRINLLKKQLFKSQSNRPTLFHWRTIQGIWQKKKMMAIFRN